MFTIHLESNSKVSLYEQIYFYIKQEIQAGKLPFGSKLPSTRGLALHLQVSRNTIDMAYAQLQSEGYIEAIAKKGYFVNQVTGLMNLSKQNATTYILPKKQEEREYKYNFSPFDVDLTHFPYSVWRQFSKNCMNQNKELFLLGSNQGDEPLRNAIATYLHQSRSVNCSKEQIIIGAGVEFLLQLLIQLFPSNTWIAMENPTYKKAYQIFEGLSRKTCAIALDEQGLDVKKLRESKANIAYVMPSHQFPLGIVMPIKRRLELLDWALEQEERYIIEDDHDSEFRYKGKPIPSLQGIDSNGRVIYIGTFSKAIAPSIRVAYMVLPKKLLEKYQRQLYYYSCTVSRVDQSIITDFLEKGHFERHLNRMRKVYRTKHDVLLQALKVFGKQIRISGEHAGLHLVLEFLIDIPEKDVIMLAQKVGIHLYGLSEYFVLPFESSYTTLVLGYANLSEEAIRESIQLLYETMKTQGWLY